MILRFKTFISEALKPSEYRQFVKGWDRSRFEKIFKNPKYKTDRKAFRVYIPLGKGGRKTYNWQSREMDTARYLSVEMESGSQGRYFIRDSEEYIEGFARDRKNRRKIKIGKVINKVSKNDPSRKTKLLRLYNNDPIRQAKNDNYIAVISRHPYDIAGMSTDRGWTSCMNLRGGRYSERYVPVDIKKGSLIAYATKEDDPDLKNPVCRVMIKPFVEVEKWGDDNVQDPDIFFGVENRVYGEEVDGFVDAVIDWVEEVNQSKALNKVLEVELRSGIYPDGMQTTKRIFSKKIVQELEFYFNHPQTFSDNYFDLDDSFKELFLEKLETTSSSKAMKFIREFFDYHVKKKKRNIGSSSFFEFLDSGLEREGVFDSLTFQDQYIVSKKGKFRDHLPHVRNPKSDHIISNILTKWSGAYGKFTTDFEKILRAKPHFINANILRRFNTLDIDVLIAALQSNIDDFYQVTVIVNFLGELQPSKSEFFKFVEAWEEKFGGNFYYLLSVFQNTAIKFEFFAELVEYLVKKYGIAHYKRYNYIAKHLAQFALAAVEPKKKDEIVVYSDILVDLVDFSLESKNAVNYFADPQAFKKIVKTWAKIILDDSIDVVRKEFLTENFAYLGSGYGVLGKTTPPISFDDPLINKAMKKAEEHVQKQKRELYAR